MSDSGFLIGFPGQGSQYVGMGKALVEQYPTARRTFEEASDACGINLLDLCLNGPEDQLKLTANTQPCILTHSIAVWRILNELRPINATYFAGHSLGEYSALVAAGKLDFARAVYLVRQRGLAMQEAVPEGVGAMAAVLNMPAADLHDACAKASTSTERVETVNFNSPQQLVVAGHKFAVDRLMATLSTSGIKAVPLAVSAPFHSSLMAPAREKMGPLLMDTQFHQTAAVIIANLTGEPVRHYTAEFLIQQIDHAVKWTQSMDSSQKLGCTTYLEVGPGRVLAGLWKRILGRDAKIINCEDPASAINQFTQ
jgi:[acyl-carrier-protein] S-malonyltransferase